MLRQRKTEKKRGVFDKDSQKQSRKKPKKVQKTHKSKAEKKVQKVQSAKSALLSSSPDSLAKKCKTKKPPVLRQTVK